MKIDEIKLLYYYNNWADTRVLAACARVCAEQYAAQTTLGTWHRREARRTGGSGNPKDELTNTGGRRGHRQNRQCPEHICETKSHGWEWNPLTAEEME